jgi:subtilase family serine protease
MKRMLLVLKRSPEQDSALLSLIDSQQDKRSPNYHKWLTPKEFGTRFGPSDSDVAAVSNWLKSSGFQVADPSAGRTIIEFSGTASLVQAAFNTAIHKYVVNGKQHWANANDLEIPAALAPVVVGVQSLHNFFKQPQIAQMKEVDATFTKTPQPQVTFTDGKHALAPGDYFKIYNFPTTVTGTNATIAVVARSEYNTSDLASFYATFGLSRNPPTFVFNGDTPGDLGAGEEGEAILDATWSSALAQGANVDFVVSASTNTTDGVDLSEIYIVDNNLADVMTESFGSCEANHSPADAGFVGSLAEQAAAEGITYTVSTGDSGAEGCDRPSMAPATGPVSANLLSATPFNIAVGGTMFVEGSGNYWGPANGPNPTALSHIPENVWNESCSAAQCGANAALWSAGSGVSQYFSKPSWQSGVTGIPSDGARDQPDVVLTAAAHDAYLVCLQGSCSTGRIFFFSGTSAAAPSFAAIMALVNQKTGSRQGQANYVLYRLAAADIAAARKCNGSTSTLPAATCNFNDITAGNNAVPGEAGFGTSSGLYQSATGYDLASGLGSVNVTNLLNNWSTATFTPSATTLTLSPTTITHGAAVNVHVNVTPTTATGDISLRNGDITPLSGSGFIDQKTLSGGSFIGTTSFLPGGTYHVRAHYAGDATFAASDSASPGVSVTVNPEASTTALAVFGVDANGATFPYTSEPYGTPAYLRADVAGASGQGIPSGSLNFLDNGVSLLGSSSPVLNSQGTAATAQGFFTISPGVHSMVGQYVGDVSFMASNSTPVSITVTKGPTLSALVPSLTSAPSTSPVTLNATINTNSLGVAPTGTVTFLSGGVAVTNAGNPAPVSGTNGVGNIQPTPPSFAVAAGSATLTSTLPIGADSITAQYNGDANYSASTSAPVTVTIGADFDFTPATAPITVTRGSSGTATFTVTGHTGFTGNVVFSSSSCTGLPSESSCSFSPTTVASGSSTVLSIKTTAPTSAGKVTLSWWATGSSSLFAALFLLAAPRRRRWSTALSLLLFASLTTIVACGGGGGGGGTHDPGTPVGTYTVTVKATDSLGVVSHTAVVTLNVQ